MRVIAVSLLVAAPALVSAVAVPVRRSNSGFGTWYYTQTGNAGSCGSYLSDSDYTVAMNSFQYNDGMCGKTISITANGKTTQARVMDLCPNGGGNCNWGDVDMSPSLFSYFADQGAGKIPITWDFVGDSAPAPAPEPTTTPATTPTQDAPPQVPTLPTSIDTAGVNYETPSESIPTQPPVAAAEFTPAPEPDTTSTSCTDTTSWTSTETASAADVTPTPTPPTLAEQVAQAMNNGNVYDLGGAFIQLGNMLQSPNPNPTR